MASVAAVLPRKLAHALAQDKPARREQARAQEIPQQAAARETVVQAHSTEERVSVLEARWEETIPALATKADLAEVNTSMVRWVIGAGASVLVAFIGLTLASHHSTNARFDQVNVRIDQLQSDTNARFDQVNARIDQLQNETNARFDQMNARLDRLFELIASQQAASRPQ